MKYKDSGYEWIGIIPEQWKVEKLKYHLRRNEPRNPGNKMVLSLYRELGIVPKDSRDDNHNVTSEDTSNYKYVQIGDFVINKMKAWQGSVAVSDYEGIVSPAYYVYNFIDDVFDRRYFHYLIRSCYKDEFMRLSGGIRAGQWDLPSSALDSIPLLIPSKEEQKHIARELDILCEKIEVLVEKAKETVTRYKQWKIAMVYEAVTKGLKADVPFIESDILHIGKVPAHWKLIPNKYIMKKKKEICEKWKGEAVMSLTMNGVIVRDLENPSGKMPTTFDGYQYVNAGELLMCLFDIDVTPRCVGRVFQDGVTSPAYSSFVLSNDADLDYYYYYYLMLDNTKELLTYAKNLRHSLTEEQLGLLKVPLPPLEEQKEIAKYLDFKIGKIDGIIAEKEMLIAKLDEYKKAMIFEFVTGKKVVK